MGHGQALHAFYVKPRRKSVKKYLGVASIPARVPHKGAFVGSRASCRTGRRYIPAPGQHGAAASVTGSVFSAEAEAGCCRKPTKCSPNTTRPLVLPLAHCLSYADDGQHCLPGRCAASAACDIPFQCHYLVGFQWPWPAARGSESARQMHLMPPASAEAAGPLNAPY